MCVALYMHTWLHTVGWSEIPTLTMKNVHHSIKCFVSRWGSPNNTIYPFNGQVQVYFSRASLYLQIKNFLAVCVASDSNVDNEAYFNRKFLLVYLMQYSIIICCVSIAQRHNIRFIIQRLLGLRVQIMCF
jgi:hypothetical protein